MDEDNDLEGVKAKADVMNERGHASVFARKTPEDLQIVERAAACEFSESVQAKYGLQIDNIESNPEKNGVPDCFANHEGRRIGIELTELVDCILLKEIARSRNKGEEVGWVSCEYSEGCLYGPLEVVHSVGPGKAVVTTTPAIRQETAE